MYFREEKDVFCANVFDIINKSEKETKYSTYLCLPDFPPRVLKKLEQIKGVELVWSNKYLDQANLSGTFKISNFIRDSIEVEKALFSFFSTTQYLIFTNEPDFAKKIEQPLVEYFVGILSIEDLYSCFFSGENYLVLNYEEDEEDPKLIDGYLHVSSAEMLSLWKGEFKLSCGCCNKFISQHDEVTLE